MKCINCGAAAGPDWRLCQACIGRDCDEREAGIRALRQPSAWQYGGKGQAGTWQRLINCIPPHRVFVEAFAGSAVVARNKRAAAETVVIDASPAAIAALNDGPWNAGVTVICGDARSWLAARDWRGDEFVFADPPYLFSTRSDPRCRYAVEMGTEAEHRELLALLCSLPCMVLVTHYPCALYRSTLAGWRVESYHAVTRGGTVREENIWMNYPEPTRLHDYSQLGEDFRQRERIRRKIVRQARRLSALPPLERAAVIAAAGEVAVETARLTPRQGASDASSHAQNGEEDRRQEPSLLLASTAATADRPLSYPSHRHFRREDPT